MSKWSPTGINSRSSISYNLKNAHLVLYFDDTIIVTGHKSMSVTKKYVCEKKISVKVIQF